MRLIKSLTVHTYAKAYNFCLSFLKIKYEYNLKSNSEDNKINTFLFLVGINKIQRSEYTVSFRKLLLSTKNWMDKNLTSQNQTSLWRYKQSKPKHTFHILINNLNYHKLSQSIFRNQISNAKSQNQTGIGTIPDTNGW